MTAFAELKGTRFPSLVGVIDMLMLPGIWAVIIFRTATLLHEVRLRPFSRLLYIWNMVLFGVDLPPNPGVGPGLVLPHPVGSGIVSKAVVGRRVTIYQHVNIGGGATENPDRDGFPVIGDGCWIFAGAYIVGPVTVGDNAFVSAQAMVVRSVPPGAVVFGSPARVVRYRDGYAPPARAASRTPEPAAANGHRR